MTGSPGIAVVRPPATSVAEGITTFIEREPIDLDLARRQWQHYVEAFEAHGWTIEQVGVDDDAPDSVFVEDAAFVHRGRAVACRPGALERRREVEPVARRLAELGLDVQRVEGEATIDGGDVLKVGDDVYVGRGGRTNPAGIEAVATLLHPVGARVHAVPIDAALHLKSAVTALPDGSVVGWGPVTPSDGLPPVLEMPEEAGAHVVDLGGGAVLMASGSERSAEIVRRRGYTPVIVDIGEFIKLEGCVTCLSIRIRELPA